MLGAADIESWDDDLRAVLMADLGRTDRCLPSVRAVRSPRLRRLIDHFHAGRVLTTGELEDLRAAMVPA